MRKPIIGVMGPGSNATKQDKEFAFEVGRRIALKDWIVLSGGRNEGVMEAVNQGARYAGGQTIGIIPSKDKTTISDAVDIAIMTNMGSARNYINILSSDVLVAVGMEAGTASEVAMALKDNKPVILLTANKVGNIFFKNLHPELVTIVSTPDKVIQTIEKVL